MTPSETSEYFQDAVTKQDKWIILADFDRGISDMEYIATSAACRGVFPEDMVYNRVLFTPHKVPIPVNVAWMSIPKEQFGYHQLRDTLMSGGMPYKALREHAVFVVLTDRGEGPAATFVRSAIRERLVESNCDLN